MYASINVPKEKLIISSKTASKTLDTNLPIAGHSWIVKQEIGTKEKDGSIKNSQECPVNEYTPS